MALSMMSVRPGPQPVRSGQYGRQRLDPKLLLASGILANMAEPQAAIRRASGLVAQGRYLEAKGILRRHTRTSQPHIKARVDELLGRCAIGEGGNWERSLVNALTAYRELNDPAGVARVLRYQGEMMLAKGAFEAAKATLDDAERAYQATGDRAGAAMVGTLRAQLDLRAGRMPQARAAVNAAVQTLSQLCLPHPLALAHLTRARLSARCGQAGDATRDLLAAERILAASGNASERISARLVRAESLMLLGDQERAAAGLRRVMTAAVALEEVATRADFHGLLGRAILEQNPVSARRHLMRSRHLHQSLGADYDVAGCDLTLARVELRLGLHGMGRVKGLGERLLARWPLLAIERRLLEAEGKADTDWEASRSHFRGVRAAALQVGNRALAAEVDKRLRIHGGTAPVSETLSDLTTLDPGTQQGQVAPCPALPSHQRASVSQREGPAPTPMLDEQEEPCRELPAPLGPPGPDAVAGLQQAQQAVGLRRPFHRRRRRR